MPISTMRRVSKARASAYPDERIGWFAAMLLLILPASQAQLPPEPATVRIGVFSLFHPKTLVLTVPRSVTLHVDSGTSVLDPHHPMALQSTATGILVDGSPAQRFSVAPSTFTLAVPGKLTRTYRGALTVTARGGILIPVVTIDTELAVASIVAAESPSHAPIEALKAQAVISRSYLLANPRTHRDFDACDTTHCQYLRSPPAANSPAALATLATRHSVVTWRPSPEVAPQIVPAMYSRSCGGQTRAPQATPGSYPYYSVRCEYCRQHPEIWSRSIEDPIPNSETERLAFDRAHGWSALPSNTHTASGTFVEGRGVGHGIGLCQLGAVYLAAHGETFFEIIRHYLPNTVIVNLP